MDPSQILATWDKLQKIPGGKRLFGLLLGQAAPYSGTIDPRIEELRLGYARVALEDRRAVRNHLKSVHAIALMNLGEVSTGLAMYTGLPKGGRGILVELGMTYTKKARGRLTAEATCVLPETPGKHDVRIEAALIDATGVTVARAHAVWRVELPQVDPTQSA